MPQPAKTLPDPMKAVPAATGPNADEILSQLAGEEIDRLLAEAESPRSDPVPPLAVAKATNVSPSSSPAPSSPAPLPAEPSADQDLNQQLDALFNQLNQETGTPAAPETPAPASARPAPLEPSPSPAAEQPKAVTASSAQVTSSLANDVLAATELAAIPEPPARENVAQSPPKEEPGSGEPPVSLFLRPLVRLSSLFPETALDWMGKVAILTTLNAMAIFAYILIRRH
ncbi:MAG: hypothetical protein ABSH20_20910 [Tepidisphaeraceae bacterium]|jgi:hypothetical protein